MATRPLMENENGNTVEFRAYRDDAWYTTRVSLEGETLTVNFVEFPDDNNNAFEASQFGGSKHLHDFKRRFRPLSKQVQDGECHILAQGTRVCACQRFGEDDLRFYDAVVDGVQRRKHSLTEKEELCLCTFVLFWLHGPNAGNLTATTIEDICIVQPEGELDPVLASFLEMARGKIDLLSSCSASASNEVSCMEMVPDCNRSSNTTCGIGYFERIEKEKRRAKRFIANVCSPEVSCDDMEDRELEGTKTMCMIMIANINRELCPSTVTEFLHRHTSVSAGVLIFPTQSWEVFTRGAIILDSEEEFQEMCDFLNNPNSIITSSSGRPWVILEKLVGLKKIEASIGTLMHISKVQEVTGEVGLMVMIPKVLNYYSRFSGHSFIVILDTSPHNDNDLSLQNISQKRKIGTSNNLKLVHSGTQEFKIASYRRDLFMEFTNHQERLHKRLALEEGRVFTTDDEKLA